MIAQGHALPLPDWIGYIVAAEGGGASPWDFQGDPFLPSKQWWMHKILVFNEAKNIVRERDRQVQESKARQQSAASKRR